MNGAAFLDFLRADFPLTPLQEARFLALEELYRNWNAQINVISRKDIDGLYSHHVLHSLAIARYLQGLPEGTERFARASVLDLGTGGGFPGIPLAILFPDASFVLCDSVGKKTLVARAVAEALELSNVRVENCRAESLPGPFDFVVSRAVASLVDFYPWVRGKFTQGILCLKGGDIGEEIAAFAARYRVPGSHVHGWPVSDWLPEAYFDGKLVVHIEK